MADFKPNSMLGKRLKTDFVAAVHIEDSDDIDPTDAEDYTAGYGYGWIWINKASGRAWICVDPNSPAVWVRFAG